LALWRRAAESCDHASDSSTTGGCRSNELEIEIEIEIGIEID